jgi:hypothetical protein
MLDARNADLVGLPGMRAVGQNLDLTDRALSLLRQSW